MTTLQRQHLDWFRLNIRERTFQLRAGRKEVISLKWDNGRHHCATAAIPDNRWVYSCIGYLSKQVMIQCALTGENVAHFVPGNGGGVLRFTDGRTYKLKSAYPVRPEMIWEDENGKALVRINGIFGFGERSGGVDLVEDLVHSPSDDNALLVSLGWYLMVSSYLDMALVL